jgi:hypothetical protein
MVPEHTVMIRFRFTVIDFTVRDIDVSLATTIPCPSQLRSLDVSIGIARNISHHDNDTLARLLECSYTVFEQIMEAQLVLESLRVSRRWAIDVNEHERLVVSDDAPPFRLQFVQHLGGQLRNK